MSNMQTLKPPVWFWAVAAVAVIWNLLGVGAFFSEVAMSAEALAKLPEEQRKLYEATPFWATAAFAVAVFAGLIGSVALALRKGWAVPFFSASLAAILAQMGYTVLGSNVVAVMGATALVMPAVIIAIGAFLVWFSTSVKGKGWLN